MPVEIEFYAPVHSIRMTTVETESNLRGLFAALASAEDASAAFGPEPNPADQADVILGYSGECYTITALRNGDYEQLIGDAAAQDEVMLRMGGQATEIPRRWVLSVDCAFDAMLAYVLTGRFPDHLQWER
jgi:hypothetical protein